MTIYHERFWATYSHYWYQFRYPTTWVAVYEWLFYWYSNAQAVAEWVLLLPAFLLSIIQKEGDSKLQ